MPPKQYFGMGAFYMYAHYLGKEWLWNDRFRSGAEYVTKSEKPHKEFLFVKIIEKNIYVPLSSVLRTFHSKSYTFNSRIVHATTKSGDAEYKETATYVEFSKMSQHLDEYYVGLSDFMKAANTCRAGISYKSTPKIVRRKADGLFFLSEMLLRPNVLVIETTSPLLGQIGDL